MRKSGCRYEYKDNSFIAMIKKKKNSVIVLNIAVSITIKSIGGYGIDF